MIFFSTDLHGLLIRICVPTGLSQFPGTCSLFEFAKYICHQAAFFFNSHRLIAKSSRQLLVTQVVLLSQKWPCMSLGVPFFSWPHVTLKTPRFGAGKEDQECQAALIFFFYLSASDTSVQIHKLPRRRVCSEFITCLFTWSWSGTALTRAAPVLPEPDPCLCL